MSKRVFEDRVGVYEALIDWPKRLANEEPFYRALFERIGVGSVLDVACGTGHHAAMFQSWGLKVVGADVSPAMIEACERRFGQAESLSWIVRSFDQPHDPPESFDAVICVGNSLSLAADLKAVESALRSMLGAVRRGGVCVVQVLNLWALPDGPCNWQKCKRISLDGGDHILVKGVHRCGSHGYVNLIDLNLSEGDPTPHYESTPLLGLEADDLVRILETAGASDIRCCGDFQQNPYDRGRSTDVIVIAVK